jgi:hypothetical protein
MCIGRAKIELGINMNIGDGQCKQNPYISIHKVSVLDSTKKVAPLPRNWIPPPAWELFTFTINHLGSF